MLTCNDPDVDEPVVVSGVRGSDTVQDTTEDSNDHREDQGKNTVFRLVDTTIALSTPLDQSVGTVSEKGQSDDGGDDLTTVGVTGTVLSPVVRGSSNNATISRTDGDISTKREAVQAKSPKNIREEKHAEHLLSVAISDLKI